MPPATQLDDLERALLEAVSPERLWEYVSLVARDVRMSGSPEEREVMRAIVGILRSFGAEVEEYEHDGYVSEPLRAALTVLGPASASIECITHAFAASGRVAGELVHVGDGAPADYAGRPVTGRIALIEGLATQAKVVTAEAQGAAAEVFINDCNLHQMIVTPR